MESPAGEGRRPGRRAEVGSSSRASEVREDAGIPFPRFEEFAFRKGRLFGLRDKEAALQDGLRQVGV